MREVFADKNVDAVSMPLPNHWHALATIWACQAGKDVYVEKPACHNIFEGQQMVEAARKYNRMVQIGSQSRSTPHKIKAMQLLHEGVDRQGLHGQGPLLQAAQVDRPQAGRARCRPGVDWDMFLGPRRCAPFNETRFKYNWHWFWDTGNGDIGNQGVHEMDIARWGLGKPACRKSVVSTGGKYVYNDDQETPNTQIATFDYGDAELMFEVRGMLTGSEGGLSDPTAATSSAICSTAAMAGWRSTAAASRSTRARRARRSWTRRRAHRGRRRRTSRISSRPCKSRNYQDLNADVAIGVMSAYLVHIGQRQLSPGEEARLRREDDDFPGEKEATRC